MLSNNKILIVAFIVTSFLFASCEKEYTCVCQDYKSGDKIPGDKVKTTNLGKKGFEKSCKSNSTELKDCWVE